MLTYFQNFNPFQNSDQFSKFYLFLDPFSKCWPIFKMLTHFQNFDPFSKCWPIFKILTHFQNFDQFSKFLTIFNLLMAASDSWLLKITHFENWYFFWNLGNILKILTRTKCVSYQITNDASYPAKNGSRKSARARDMHVDTSSLPEA